MIVRRIAFFIALLFGLAMTQIPAFVDQYQQRLGGAIDELAAIVARFDSDSQQQGLTESGGVDRLKANQDTFVRQRGEQMQDNIARLDSLRAAREQFKSETPAMQLATFVTHYDPRVAQGAYNDFKPAVPASPEAAVLGLVGFVFGGGVVHLTNRQVRRRRVRTAPAVRENAA